MALRRRICNIGLVGVLLLITGVVVAQDRGRGTAAAQTLAPAGIASGQIEFNSEGPVRIYDTRDGTGLGARAPGPILYGANCCAIELAGSVPSDTTAVMVNITLVVPEPGSYGFIAAYGTTYRGLTSTLNWNGPGVYSNFAFAPTNVISTPSPEKFLMLNWSGNAKPVHVIVDLLGWVVPVPG